MTQTRLKQLREEAVLTIHELAEASGVSDDTISKIENGQRIARPSTLRKLAQALVVSPQELRKPAAVEEGALAGKVEAPGKAGPPRPKVEPSPFEEDERRFSEIFELLESWHARRLQQVDDANDEHFRDASAAAMWIADVEEEATDVINWIVKHGESFIGGWEDLGEIAGVGLMAENPAWLGRERLRGMKDVPEGVASLKLKRATETADESRERLEKLRAASG